jgi:hypothetical protein
MTSTIGNLHDVEVVGVKSRNRENALVLSLEMSDGAPKYIEFQKVKSFRIVDFVEQNVISRIYLSSESTISGEYLLSRLKWLYSRSDVDCVYGDKYLENIITDIRCEHKIFFALEPSAGAEMVVLAGAVRVSSVV